MRARTTITAILGATLFFGVASSVSAQVRPLPDDTLEFHYEGRRSVWMALGQVTAAVDAYQRAHAAAPGDRIACYNLVMILNQLGRSAEAARYAECARTAR